MKKNNTKKISIFKKDLAAAKEQIKNLNFYKTKFSLPTKKNIKEKIFAENLDYFTTGKTSIWGTGDPDTLKFLNSLSLSL